jgi:predicted GIY-YIG superfamily endonuclease
MVTIGKPWFLYMLRCADGSLYTGVSNRLEVRVKNHSLGKGARYTRARLPVKLVFSLKVGTYSEALKKEYWLKSQERKTKTRLAKAWIKKTLARKKKNRIKN